MIFSAHYSVGTVFVVAGSSSVVGAGTSFVGNVKAGDYLLAGGVLERIAAVVDATHLTLARPWSGATISASAYDVVVVLDAVGYQRAVADLLERMLSDDPDGFYTRAEVDGYRSADQNAAKNAGNLSAGTVPDARLPVRLGRYAVDNIITDANLAVETGTYRLLETAINTPSPSHWELTVVQSLADWGGQYARCLFTPYDRWRRDLVGGTWTAWQRDYGSAEEIQLAVSLTPAGAVGSYIFAYHATAGGNWGAPGLLVAGSDLRATNAAGTTSWTLSGTWRLMGAGSGASPSLFLRIV